MSRLDDDIKKYAEEAWDHHDIGAGLKLLAELGGVATLGVFAYTVLTSWVPGLNALGIPIAAGTVHALLKLAADHYASLPEDERAVVRKVVRFLNGVS